MSKKYRSYYWFKINFHTKPYSLLISTSIKIFNPKK